MTEGKFKEEALKQLRNRLQSCEERRNDIQKEYVKVVESLRLVDDDSIDISSCYDYMDLYQRMEVMQVAIKELYTKIMSWRQAIDILECIGKDITNSQRCRCSVSEYLRRLDIIDKETKEKVEMADNQIMALKKIEQEEPTEILDCKNCYFKTSVRSMFGHHCKVYGAPLLYRIDPWGGYYLEPCRNCRLEKYKNFRPMNSIMEE